MLTESETELVQRAYSFRDKKMKFSRLESIGSNLITAFSLYLKSEHQIVIGDNNTVELFNQRFSFEVETFYKELPKGNIVIRHLILDHNLELKGKIEVFRMEVSQFSKYEYHGESNAYPVMFGAILKYLENHNEPLNKTVN